LKYTKNAHLIKLNGLRFEECSWLSDKKDRLWWCTVHCWTL